MYRFIIVVFGFGVLGVGNTWAQSSKVLNHVNVRIQNAASVNTEEMDFAPVPYGGGVVFVSRFKNGTVDPKTGKTFYELFYAERDANDMPQKPVPFSLNINSQWHEGPVCFNRNENQIFFTRSYSKGGVVKADKKGKVHLAIYEAQRTPFDWEYITLLPFNNPQYSCMHPTLSANGKVLYFSSNMPGGYGGYDLYVVEKRDGRWLKPVNLGPEINTSRNEVSPFIHESGTLFFASDGHDGYGGLDVYMIDLATPGVSTLFNMGQPFNTPNDDHGLIINRKGTKGYLASNRPESKGMDDVFLFETPERLSGLDIPPQYPLAMSVYDMNSSRKLDKTRIFVFEEDPDAEFMKSLYEYDILGAEGDQQKDMSLRLVRKKETDLGQPTQVTGANGETNLLLAGGRSYIFLVSHDGYTTQEIKYTTPDDGRMRPLDVGLEPLNCITLEGKIQLGGSNQGVPFALIKVRNKETGVVTTVRSDVDGQYRICIQAGFEYGIAAGKTGYIPATSQVSTIRLRASQSLNVDLRLNPGEGGDAFSTIALQAGSTITLKDIYYDFGKAIIRPGEAQELEALAQLMFKYQGMRIELGAHTDSRGADDFNLELSQQRAEAAKTFLVRKGITATRIETRGYGENMPKNKCTNNVPCLEEEHRLNRRTEVKILQFDPLDLYNKP